MSTGVTQIGAGLVATWGIPQVFDGLFQEAVSAETTITINPGNSVRINTSGKILRGSTTANDMLTCGVAIETIAPGALGKYAPSHNGILVQAVTTGTVAAGDILAESTTAGTLVTNNSATVGQGVAIAIAANAAQIDGGTVANRTSVMIVRI